MSRFFVGQRVRIRDSGDVIEEFVGLEATVMDLSMPEHLIAISGKGRFSARPDALEPILPEGAAPSEFKTLRDLLTSLEGVAA